MVDLQVDQVVGEQFSNQKFGRNIIEFFLSFDWFCFGELFFYEIKKHHVAFFIAKIFDGSIKHRQRKFL